jgi:hypothetical protein
MAEPPDRPMRATWPALNKGRWWLYALSLLAGLAAAPFGYDVGQRIAGSLIGWVMALNSAVFCTLVAGAVLDRAARLFKPDDDRDRS